MFNRCYGGPTVLWIRVGGFFSQGSLGSLTCPSEPGQITQPGSSRFKRERNWQVEKGRQDDARDLVRPTPVAKSPWTYHQDGLAAAMKA
jgi:hypothetical protein